MKLISIRLKNYRCFQDSGELPLQKFAVFIGRNDSGKSSVLAAISIALNSKGNFSDEDHWIDSATITDVNPQGIRAAELEVFLLFNHWC